MSKGTNWFERRVGEGSELLDRESIGGGCVLLGLLIRFPCERKGERAFLFCFDLKRSSWV